MLKHCEPFAPHAPIAKHTPKLQAPLQHSALFEQTDQSAPQGPPLLEVVLVELPPLLLDVVLVELPPLLLDVVLALPLVPDEAPVEVDDATAPPAPDEDEVDEAPDAPDAPVDAAPPAPSPPDELAAPVPVAPKRRPSDAPHPPAIAANEAATANAPAPFNQLLDMPIVVPPRASKRRGASLAHRGAALGGAAA